MYGNGRGRIHAPSILILASLLIVAGLILWAIIIVLLGGQP